MGIRALVLVAGVAVAGQEARVTSDRVNVRAKPVNDAEVIGQVNQGDALTVLKVEEVWAEVQAPTNMGVWVKGEFVRNGAVAGDKVNVRSGPGVSYRSVGSVRGGAAVQVREVRGEWTCIVPPEGVSLWIKKEFLDLGTAGSSGTGQVAVVTATSTAVVEVVESQAFGVSTNATLTRELPAGLKEGQLAAVLGQGAVIDRQGVLERVPLAIFRGVEYRLVDMEDGRRVTTCYLRGRDAEMPGLMGKRVKAKGPGWWLSGEKCPLVYLDEVVVAGE
jgi:uncharacterized protein YraI